MNHSPSNVQVFQTANYNAFARIKGNRELNELKIKKMIRDINHGLNLLADFPLVVTEEGNKLHVIDGQHRLEAAKKTKKEVYYIIRKQSLSLDKMARFNSLQEKWSVKDFIECYIEKGVQDYMKLKTFIEQYEVPASISIRMLHCGIIGNDGGNMSDLTEQFHRGEFKCKHWKQAVDIVESCKRFSKSKYWNSRPFMIAITKILAADLCDFDELVEKFEANPDALEYSGNFKGCLLNLERIYNKGYQKRRTIY
jgi:hypothetical protein